MDRGGQGRDQMDAAVVEDVRDQHGAVSASRARLQSRQFLADVGDARADDGRSNMTSRQRIFPTASISQFILVDVGIESNTFSER
jgi:hypothetical protein